MSSSRLDTSVQRLLTIIVPYGLIGSTLREVLEAKVCRPWNNFSDADFTFFLDHDPIVGDICIYVYSKKRSPLVSEHRNRTEQVKREQSKLRWVHWRETDVVWLQCGAMQPRSTKSRAEHPRLFTQLLMGVSIQTACFNNSLLNTL